METKSFDRAGKAGGALRLFLAVFLLLGLNLYMETKYVQALQNGGFMEAEAGSGSGSGSRKIVLIEGPRIYEAALAELGLEIYEDHDTDSLFYEYTRCSDPAILSRRINRLAAEVYREPEDAGFFIDEEGTLQIRAEQDGAELDAAALLAALSDPGLYRPLYPLPVIKTTPRIFAEQLALLKPEILWSEYATLLADNPDRTENVRTAAAALDGLIIKPGETVSFNTAVGPRIPERGYRQAKIIAGGKFENGLGGGVCQVSSTLYNALLLAGLEILERSNHSLAIAYVPLGRDATVVYGQKDLVFRNATDRYLLVRSGLEGLKLKIAIWGGGKNPFENIALTSRIIKTYAPAVIKVPDASAPQEESRVVQRGQPGYLVETVRMYTSGGQEITEVQSYDFYETIPEILAINPKKL